MQKLTKRKRLTNLIIYIYISQPSFDHKLFRETYVLKSILIFFAKFVGIALCCLNKQYSILTAIALELNSSRYEINKNI